MRPTTHAAAWRLLTPLIVLALLASALFVGQRLVSANDAFAGRTRRPGRRYINYVAPQIERSTSRQGSQGQGRRLPTGQQVRPRPGHGDRPQVRFGQPQGRATAGQARGQGDQAEQEPAPDQAGEGHAGGEAPDHPRRIQPDGERRLHDVDGPRDRVREPHVRARHRPERPGPQQHPEPGDLQPRRQQLDVGAGLLDHPLRQHALHEDRHHPARPDGPDRSRRPAGLRHLRLHDEEHVRGDVQGRVHRRRRGHASGSPSRTPRPGMAPRAAPSWTASGPPGSSSR